MNYDDAIAYLDSLPPATELVARVQGELDYHVMIAGYPHTIQSELVASDIIVSIKEM